MLTKVIGKNMFKQKTMLWTWIKYLKMNLKQIALNKK